jgi:hypothetical protein
MMAALTSSLPDLPGTAHHYQECQSRLQLIKRSSSKVLQLGIKRTTDKIFCLIQFCCGLFFATLLTVYKLPGGSEWDVINTVPSSSKFPFLLIVRSSAGNFYDHRSISPHRFISSPVSFALVMHLPPTTFFTTSSSASSSLISPMASQIRHVQDAPVHFTAAEVKRGR